MTTTRTPRFLLLAAAASALAVLTGCRGDRSDSPPRQFFPDMDDQPKFKAQGESDFFADGRTMRQPVAGTVAFGRSDAVPAETSEGWGAYNAQERAKLLKDDERVFTGKDPASGDFLTTIPVTVTAAMIKRGQEQFNINCAACHGYTGDGKGMVGQRWSYPLPTFHDPKYRDPKERTGQDGYLWWVTRNGVIGPDGSNKMPGYAHAIDELESWAVVAYIRALQDSHLGTLEDAPTTERQRLENSRPPAPAPAPDAPATPAAPAGGTQ